MRQVGSSNGASATEDGALPIRQILSVIAWPLGGCVVKSDVVEFCDPGSDNRRREPGGAILRRRNFCEREAAANSERVYFIGSCHVVVVSVPQSQFARRAGCGP